jgi:hypothetical protein
MTESRQYPEDRAMFDALLVGVERVVDTEIRLPSWPLRDWTAAANVDVCQYSNAIEGAFGPVLQALADFHGDEVVTTVVLDPTPAYYHEHYGTFPAFSLSRDDVAASFWECVSFEPGGDPTGAVVYTANVVTAVGDSGAWAVWAERSWDLAVVLSATPDGPWLACGVPFVPITTALADFTEPDFKTPLSPTARRTFLQNFDPPAGRPT